MGLGDTFGFYAYKSDQGGTFAVKLSAAVAAAGGFSFTSPPPAGVGWPYQHRDMRHVTGKDGAGHHCSLPVADPGDSLYRNGGTFTLHGRTYAVTGSEGERRISTHIR